MEQLVADLLTRREVCAAREWLECHDAGTLALQRALAEIPAPTGAEELRGALVAERFEELNLADVRRDGAGNVLGRLGPNGGVGVVLAAHLDTVFGPETDLTVRDAGARLVGPGIGDNARGLAALLAVAGACRAAGIEPPLPLTFAATVGEVRASAAASFSRLCAVHISAHSADTLRSPRNRNWRNPRPCLI